MCGRFALYSSAVEIKEKFNLDYLPEFQPRYNIAPSLNILCIKHTNDKSEALMMRWGIVPFWQKYKLKPLLLTNARAESVADKPAFKESFQKRRCIVIMSGFYEWKTIDGTKQPYYFQNADNSPLAIASIWDKGEDKEGNIINTCCLITTSANELMQPIHDRMPVALNEEQQKRWLNEAVFKKEEIQEILAPCPADTLYNYPVTSKMNNSRFENKEAVHDLAKGENDA